MVQTNPVQHQLGPLSLCDILSREDACSFARHLIPRLRLDSLNKRSMGVLYMVFLLLGLRPSIFGAMTTLRSNLRHWRLVSLAAWLNSSPSIVGRIGWTWKELKIYQNERAFAACRREDS